MPKYRVKDHVGTIRHGVGKDVKDYAAGALIELSADEASGLSAYVEPVGKDGKDGKDK